MYLNGAIKKYLDDLASKKPTPGGGSVAALSAALGVGLMSMVINYTINNPAYSAFKKEMEKLLGTTELFRARLEKLIDEDVEAYKRLSDAMKRSGDNLSAVEGEFKSALVPPLEVCKICAQSLKICMKLAESGNKKLVTDTAIAAIMLEGAFFSAKYNVYVNLKYVNDVKTIEEAHNSLFPLEQEISKLKEEILEKCEDVIAK